MADHSKLDRELEANAMAQVIGTNLHNAHVQAMAEIEFRLAEVLEAGLKEIRIELREWLDGLVADNGGDDAGQDS